MLVPTLARQIMGWERRPALKSKWKSSVSALDTQKKTLFHYARGKDSLERSHIPDVVCRQVVRLGRAGRNKPNQLLIAVQVKNVPNLVYRLPAPTNCVFVTPLYTFLGYSPSQSALTILVYQVDLIFFQGLELLKYQEPCFLQNAGCKKTGSLLFKKRRDQAASSLFE